MLAELAAANAAFAVIKQAVSNGKEIAAAGSAIAEFVGAKEKLQAKARVARREAEAAAAIKRRKIIDGIIIGIILFAVLLVVGGVVALILHHQGRL